MDEEKIKIQDIFYLNAFNMTWDEFSMLSDEKQKEYIEKYQKSRLGENSKNSIVGFGYGEDLIFIKYLKGTKVFTSEGYIIAGQTEEEHKQAVDARLNLAFGKLDKEYYTKELNRLKTFKKIFDNNEKGLEKDKENTLIRKK